MLAIILMLTMSCSDPDPWLGRSAVPAPGVALSLAIADPPYPGLAWLYRGHPDYAGEVDHAELLRQLGRYDGWALATSAEALPMVLRLAHEAGLTPRVASWHRTKARACVLVEVPSRDRRDPPTYKSSHGARG